MLALPVLKTRFAPVVPVAGFWSKAEGLRRAQVKRALTTGELKGYRRIVVEKEVADALAGRLAPLLGDGQVVFLPPGTMHGFELGPQVFGTAVFFGRGSDVTLPDEPLHLRERDAAPQAELSAVLDALLVAGQVSRLVYDCNRAPTAPDAIPARSEIYDIPGNRDLVVPEQTGRLVPVGDRAGFARQMNILLTGMSVPVEQIVMDPITGAMGYGIEYTYSVMERIRMSGLGGDAPVLQEGRS